METIQDLFGLQYNPFAINQGGIETKFMSEDLRQARLRMKRTAKEGGICLLTGDPGKGISFTLGCTIPDLESMGFTVKCMTVNHVSARDFYKSLCKKTDTNFQGKTRGALIDSICENEWQMKAQGHPLFLVFDKSENMPPDVIRDLHHFIHNGHPPESLASIALCGAKEINSKIRANTTLRSLVCDFYAMSGLSEEETGKYIRHKLHLAGGGDSIVTDEAVKTLYSYTASGTYNAINNLMRDALYLALQLERAQIDPEIIRSSAAHQF